MQLCKNRNELISCVIFFPCLFASLFGETAYPPSGVCSTSFALVTRARPVRIQQNEETARCSHESSQQKWMLVERHYVMMSVGAVHF